MSAGTGAIMFVVRERRSSHVGGTVWTGKMGRPARHGVPGRAAAQHTGLR